MLQLTTSQRNELQDCLDLIREETVDHRSSSFQSSWDFQQCHPHFFSFKVLGSQMLDLQNDPPTSVLLPRGEADLKLWREGDGDSSYSAFSK